MAFAETFKALSDPVRREILNLLKGGRLTAGEIAGQFDMTAATVSYHLSQLKKAGLIFESREKNFIYYSLNASVLEEVLLWLQDARQQRDDDLNPGGIAKRCRQGQAIAQHRQDRQTPLADGFQRAAHIGSFSIPIQADV